MEKKEVIKNYNLSKKQVELIENYLLKLELTNQKFNLVGRSTFTNPWDRHINDSLQLSNFIKDKSLSIIDMGTGAGIPGLILSIYGYKNIVLTDSKKKKINFINEYTNEHKLVVKTICTRVENIKNQKFDFIVCRAFASLTKILNYSLIFSRKNTSLLFLKGRNVKNEIHDAKKNYKFKYQLYDSKSTGGGFVLRVNELKKL